MGQMDNELEATKLERYLNKEGFKNLVEEIRGASPDTLDAKLLGISKHNQDIQNTKNEDKELRQARERVSMLGASYREQLRNNAKIARFIALVMQERGVDLAPAKPEIPEESDIPGVRDAEIG
jgi:hypothetical protein